MNEMFNASFDEELCGETLKLFRDDLLQVYGITATVIGVLGLITNALNVIVLTKEKMLDSAICVILLWISVADFSYLIAIISRILSTYGVLNMEFCISHSFNLQTFSLICHFCYVNFHFISVTLTLLLMLWRFLAVSNPIKFRVLSTTTKTSWLILLCFVLIPTSNVMLYFSYTVTRVNMTNFVEVIPNNSYSCLTYDTEYARNWSHNVTVLIHTIIFQLILPIGITILSLMFVKTAYKRHIMRLKLCNNVRFTKFRSWQRIATMTLYMCVYFLVTEFSQGVVLIWSLAKGMDVQNSCHRYLQEMHDLLAIIYKSTNIVLYTFMLPTKDFKFTLKKVLSLK
ncbi:hypothetical protein CHUAL_011117 [Chamberlinius hualienensis]